MGFFLLNFHTSRMEIEDARIEFNEVGRIIMVNGWIFKNLFSNPIRLFSILLHNNWNVALNFGSMALCNAFGNPNHIAHFLFLQFNECVEDAKMELMQIGLDIQFDLKIKII
jgi:hypothetical protein